MTTSRARVGATVLAGSALVAAGALAPTVAARATSASHVGAAAAGSHRLPTYFAPQFAVGIPHSSKTAVSGYKYSKKGAGVSQVGDLTHGKYSHFVKTPKTFTTYGIAAGSAKSIFLVGAYYNSTTGVSKTSILESQGKHWKKEKLPTLPTGASLSAISASSANNVWAVGYLVAADLKQETLHYNGKKWSLVETPSTGTDTVTHVSTTAGNSAWIAQDDTLMYWNGKAWSQPHNVSVNITALGSDGKKSLVLGAVPNSKGKSVPVSVYYNGSKYAKSKLPVHGKYVGISSMTMHGSSAWAVGYTESSTKAHAVALHGSKGKWKALKVPASLPGSVSLSLTSSTSASSAQAFGGWTEGTCGTPHFKSGTVLISMNKKRVTLAEASKSTIQAAVANRSAWRPDC